MEVAVESLSICFPSLARRMTVQQAWRSSGASAEDARDVSVRQDGSNGGWAHLPSERVLAFRSVQAALRFFSTLSADGVPTRATGAVRAGRFAERLRHGVPYTRLLPSVASVLLRKRRKLWRVAFARTSSQTSRVIRSARCGVRVALFGEWSKFRRVTTLAALISGAG